MLLSDVYISAHELFALQTIGHMRRINIVSKNLLANVFAIVAKEIIEKNYVRKSLTNVAKIARITNVTRFKT